MKNKFEALTAFQSWPEDWQRLCAEYWAENDKPASVHVSLHPAWEALHKATATAIDEPSTMPAKPCKRKRTGRSLLSPPWSPSDDELIVQLHDRGLKRHEIVKQLMSLGVKRTKHAIASRHCFLRRKNWQVG